MAFPLKAHEIKEISQSHMLARSLLLILGAMRRKEKLGSRKKKTRAVIRLEDLAPRKPVSGGATGRLFGERGDLPDLDRPTPGGEEKNHQQR